MTFPHSDLGRDAIQLLAAVADTFGERSLGFSLHVASVTARFVAARGGNVVATDAAYYAGALHGIGAVASSTAPHAGERAAALAAWDEPVAGAAFAATGGVFPAGTADAIRWHREAFDGTGFPDRLRWDGIPPTAMALNVCRAFVEGLDGQAERGGSAADAVFTLVNASGTVFALDTMRSFRAFLAAHPNDYDTPYEPAWKLPVLDAQRLVAHLCARIDARSHDARRGDRLERLVRAIGDRQNDPQLDIDRAAFAARLIALGRIGSDSDVDEARRATRLLRTVPGFAVLANLIESSVAISALHPAQRRIRTALDPLAEILANALADDALATAGSTL